ncbi:MAG TPA: hypothetical protein VNA12_06055 [Mycobacteriales bacterium]|nr:hypothetical protein [Mycobacteriales bacterium]
MFSRGRPLATKMPVSLLPRSFVDRLPESWWALANIHFIPYTSQTWHFCVMPREYDGVPVRTVDAFGQRIAWGKKPFDFEASQRDGEVLAARRELEWEREEVECRGAHPDDPE